LSALVSCSLLAVFVDNRCRTGCARVDPVRSHGHYPDVYRIFGKKENRAVQMWPGRKKKEGPLHNCMENIADRFFCW
jgi:hypothetical protein